MDERIEAFLLEVLEDEGKDSNVVRANTRCYVALYIEMFRAREAEDHKKDDAAQRCHDLSTSYRFNGRNRQIQVQHLECNPGERYAR